MDLIDRQAAIEAIASAMPSLTTPDGCGQFDHEIQVTDEAFVDCMKIIHELPSAQPMRKKGEWIVYKAPDKQHCGLVKCPFCGEELIAEPNEYHFCPACGCQMMRGEQDG